MTSSQHPDRPYRVQEDIPPFVLIVPVLMGISLISITVAAVLLY